LQVSKAKKLKVDCKEGQQGAQEKEPEKKEQNDHNYRKKSDEVAGAVPEFLRSLQQAAGCLLVDPGGGFRATTPSPAP
jgi:hypothetical protein